MSATERALEWFADWFASRGGVLQTTVVLLVIVTIEAIFGGLDPHGFWLLYWCTVYSAVTQPVLAYCSRRAAAKADLDVAAVKAEEDQILATVTVRCVHCGVES